MHMDMCGYGYLCIGISVYMDISVYGYLCIWISVRCPRGASQLWLAFVQVYHRFELCEPVSVCLKI